MGMYGEVLGIGPFRRELVPFLQQPEAWHQGTRERAVIVVPVFSAPEGSSRSREMAGFLGDDDGLPERITVLKDAGFQFYFRMEPSRLTLTSP
ncbi:hypothetical protein [Corallococcus carmarthensis]|nr:hypothetical protein [Corallococcus carmarthensis]